MRWYEEFPQPSVADTRCPLCKSDTCRNAPTVKERERSAVLQISRLKMAQQQRQQQQQQQQQQSCGGDEGGEAAAALAGDKQDVACDKWRSKSSSSSSTSSSPSGLDLRSFVAVRNTVRRLEEDMHAEILAAFASPVPLG